MRDDTIHKVEDVYERRYTGDIYFTLLGNKCKYCSQEFNIMENFYQGNAFYYLANDEWFVHQGIKYLFELDNTEDEELNYFQSTDFNAGVIYNQIEREVVKDMIGRKGVMSVGSGLSIPIIQLIPQGVALFKQEKP